MRKFIFAILLIFITNFCFSLDVNTYLNIIPEALTVEFFSTQSSNRLSSLSPVYSNLIEIIGYQNLVSNEYFIFVNSEVYPPKTSFFVPVSTDFDNIINIISNKFSIEDTSKEGRNIKRIKELNVYISKEEGNYIGVSDSVDVLLKNKFSSLDTNSVRSLRSVILKGTSEEYSYFSYASLERVSKTFSISIPNIAKYNFLEDLSFLEIYSKDDKSYQGKAYLISKDRIRQIYTPKVTRSVNIEFLPKNDILFSTSVSPNFVGDIIESFYPDILQVYPSFISDLKKTISGTFAASFSLDEFNRVKRDFLVLIGIKSKSQAERFLKSFLGLSKYKRINVNGYQLYEITISTEGKEEKFYITYTDKEYLVSPPSNTIVNFLNSIKEGNKNYTLSKGFLPMIYLNMLVNNDLRNLLTLLFLPKKGEKLILSIEPDESFNFVEISTE
jgi:hypothetical protein